MASKMKSFRANENTQYMLSRFSDFCQVSEANLIEMALDYFYQSGMCSTVADLKHLEKYTTWQEACNNAVHGGDVRLINRKNNGLGVAPVTML